MHWLQRQLTFSLPSSATCQELPLVQTLQAWRAAIGPAVHLPASSFNPYSLYRYITEG